MPAMPISRRNLLLAASAAPLFAPLLAPLASHAQGNTWPTRPVHLVVGFPGGSTPDIAARVLAEALARALGQPVVVDNKPGASGNIAADFVAKATDDHTLGIVINGNLTSSKLLYPSLPYDPARDFTELSLLVTAPLVLVALPSLPSGPTFFDAARVAGDKWNYGSVGVGSVGHLGMELLKSRVRGFAPVHVPFQGNPQVITAMLGGQVQMALVPPGVAMPQVRTGKIKAIGLTSGRSPLAPEVAPLANAGVRDFDLEVWAALLGPASLSKAAQERIAHELGPIMKSADVRQKLFDQGWQAVGTSPDGMRARVKKEAAIMAGIINAQGIKLE
ncbi:Bug family tripartite tricarboxylate transporter substrate binding protein [Variovorax sp. dw_308]|uniref:Bug family tripartite tricarboxylate transporter substrate binding protein n=1 Tax=Variovorax sp. dw_308 TaxID=2721546 RepID=UPI003529369A